jgi:hypothetical protein
MDDTRDRSGRARTFVEGLGVIVPLHKIRKPLEEFTDVDRRSVKVKKPFRKNGDSKDAADEDGPHEQTTLLDVIDHAKT